MGHMALDVQSSSQRLICASPVPGEGLLTAQVSPDVQPETQRAICSSPNVGEAGRGYRVPDDTNKPTTDQSSQQIHGNQQNISGDAEVTGPVVGGDVEQIGDRTITTTTTTTTTTTNIYNLFPQLTRVHWTAIGAVLLLVAVAAIGYATRDRWLPQPHCPPSQTCLLLAAFGPADNRTAAEITTALEQELKGVLDAAGASDDVAVMRSRAVASPQEAQTLAAEEGALLVIWGTVFEGEGKSRVHFELADRMGVGESGEVRPYRAEPLGYAPVAERIECTSCIDIEGEVTQRTQVMAWFALGLADYASAQPETAQPHFQTALFCAGEEREILLPIQPDCTPPGEVDPAESAHIRYYLGKSFVLQGDYRQGIDSLLAATQANPNDPAAWIAIGEAYTNWYGDALPNSPPAADAFAQAQRAAAGLPAATFARERAFSLGLIFELQEEFAAAAAEYTKAVESFADDDPGAYVYLLAQSRALAHSGKPAGSETALRTASTLRPDVPWAWLALAALLVEERSTAQELMQQAGSTGSDEAYIDIIQAGLCAAWADRPCAADAYAKALDKRPTSGWLYSWVGDFYLPTNPPAAGQSWEEAERHYRRAVDLRPRDPWVHQRLGYVLLNLDRPAEAADAYTAAIDLLPEDAPTAPLACILAEAQRRAGLPVTAECP